MARFTRNLAFFDVVLIGILVVLLYVFVNRLGGSKSTTSLDANPLKTENVRDIPKHGDDVAQSLHLQKDVVAKDPESVAKEKDPLAKDQDSVAKDQDSVAKDQDSVAKKQDAVAKDEQIRSEIDVRLKKIPDNRQEACFHQQYTHVVAATVIIDFFDYQLYDLKVTIGSVLQFTPADLIKEIIIVDDGSTLDHLIKEAQVYVAGIPKAILVRNEERQGRLGARLRGAREANVHNLVFLDTSVIVSNGWLDPLLDVIQEKKSVIAQPHFDKISDPVTYEYVPVKEPMVAMMSWSLTVRMGKGLKDVDPESAEHLESPMIHGAVFAVTKEYFESIGKLDPGVGDSGGENVELSLRTWFCGGQILTVPCSRVGVLNIFDPLKINSFPAIWYISEVWLKQHKNVVKSYFDHDLEKNVDTARKTAMVQRLSAITDMKCTRDMNWFMKNVATDMFAPSPDAVQFGYLKVRTGNCVRMGEDARLVLGSCRASDNKLLPAEMSFEFMKDGQLKLNDKCVHGLSNAYVVIQACSGDKELSQYWDYSHGKIISRYSHYCLMHVTDPEPKYKDEHRQILMAQQCEMDTTNKKEFSTLEFIKS